MPEAAQNPKAAPRSPEQNPNVVFLAEQPVDQNLTEHESLAQRATRRLFGDTPPEGLGFRQGVMFITGERHYHYPRALRKFCQYLNDEFGWTTERVNSWLAEPEGELRWNQMQLASHRFAFNNWWAAQKQKTHRRLLRNLRKGKS